jgi:lipoprotein-anchoring transpeptidase ErfK/SrfK
MKVPVSRSLSRRGFLTGSASLAGLAVTGCTTALETPSQVDLMKPTIDPSFLSMYGPLPSEPYPIPAIDLEKVPARFWRRQVDYSTAEPVGTVIVDTSQFYLYLVQEGGKAMRYGVGLGRAGFEWSGRAQIAWKQAWPKWTPPDEMIEREPELEKWSAGNGGMPPGLDNPLGARALYIFQDGVDTLYRIHGSPEYWTIGKAVSSGCVRLMNQDIINLYGRVPKGSPIIVV